MKSLRKLQCIILTFVLVFVSVFSTTVIAADDITIPKAVHIYSQSVDDRAISIKLPEVGDKITDLKTSSTNLVAKQTNYRTSTYDEESTEVGIGLYAKKDGKYTLSFKVCNKDGEEKQSSTITVYVNNDRAIKSATFRGKDFGGIQTVDSGAVKVTMNAGYKLVSLEYGSYKSTKDDKGNVSSNMVYKAFKNGETIKLGTEPYKYSYSSSYDMGDGNKSISESMSTSLYAWTNVRITYIDKYTNEKTETQYSIYKLALN